MATKSDDHYLIELSSAEELQEASPSRKRYDKKVIRIVLLSFLLLCAVVVIIILLIPELFGDASASNKSTGSDSRFGKLIFNEEFNMKLRCQAGAIGNFILYKFSCPQMMSDAPFDKEFYFVLN
eukprot:337132_1